MEGGRREGKESKNRRRDTKRSGEGEIMGWWKAVRRPGEVKCHNVTGGFPQEAQQRYVTECETVQSSSGI